MNNAKLRHFIIVLSVMLCFAPGALAQALPPLSGLVDRDTATALLSAGKVVRTATGEAARSTSTDLRDRGVSLIEADIQSRKPGILVEGLFYIPRPEPADPSAEFASIFTILCSISTLQGIEYWSETYRAWRTFYAESWRIDGPLSRNRLPDETPPAGARDLSLFAWQRDLTFGGNVYRYDYRALGDGATRSLLVTETNLTKMSYGIIPFVGEEGLRTSILVVPAKEGIIFYAASAANTPPLPIISGRVQLSFTNRAEAVFKWFGSRLTRARRD